MLRLFYLEKDRGQALKEEEVVTWKHSQNTLKERSDSVRGSGCSRKLLFMF